MKEIVQKLQQRGEHIATMESCTGGYLASEITNISGSSYIFRLGLVTYHNEEKIRFGVKKDTIAKYTVYSKEVAQEMAKCASQMANTEWGIGTTGILGRPDPQNGNIAVQKAYYAIFHQGEFVTGEVSFAGDNREKNKQAIFEKIREDLLEKLEER